MPKPPRRWERCLPVAGIFLLLSLGSVSGGVAQELPLKRVLPGADGFSCPEVTSGREVGEEEKAQATILGSNAGQALMLGDQTRARDLLARATELDPSSPELAYRRARILEDLEDPDGAVSEYCRALALDAEAFGINDARPRLEALALADAPQIPEEARSAFSLGLSYADQDRHREAADAFGAALRIALTLAEAAYNRGVVRDRQGDVDGAVADLRLYLAMSPGEDDAISVSQRIGQLQSSASLPSPGATLTLGMLIPGMGQFYSGRALGGLTILGLAGGAIAAGFLIEEEETLCVGTVTPGGDCPADRVISRETTKPYATQSLIAAGAVTLIGAVEAFLKVRRGGSSGDGDLLAFQVGKARVGVPSLSASGPRMTLSLLKVTF